MKVILSRKGFDSGYGGYPSPILPDGRLISFPIPDRNSSIKYSDLHIDESTTYLKIINDLIGNQLKLEGDGIVQLEKVGCHLDPDICTNSYKRLDGWKGLFGQAGSAQSHLSNMQVSEGDIFLFFGWFRDTIFKNDRLIYNKNDKTGKHVIYGYLEVGEILFVKDLNPSNWMKYHPHVARGSNARYNDYVYVAKERLSINPSLKGYGTLIYSDRVKLTKEGHSRSHWNLPIFFKDTNISYHSEKSWKEEYFQSAAKGQEFVVDSTEKIREWVQELIESCNDSEFNIV